MAKKKKTPHSAAQRRLNRDLLHSGAYQSRVERNRKKDMQRVCKHRNRQFDGLFSLIFPGM